MRSRSAATLLGLILSIGFVAPEPVLGSHAAIGQKAEKRRKAEELAKAAKPVLWRDPGAVESLDFEYGPGGQQNAPQAPFTFVEEDTDGTNPKLKVTDARGHRWGVKFGGEVNAEVVASRIAWAAGYFVEPAYFVRSGKIEGVDFGALTRVKKYLGKDGSFTNARFELKIDTLAKLKDDQGWAWNANPFAGAKELAGLKVVMMLTSNWDNKDVRDVSRGSNTAVFVVEGSQGNEARYYVTDWGGSMGKWGGVFGREKWDADGYASQSPKFLSASGGKLDFGYSGQHTSEWKSDITASDVAWIAQYLGRITDEQLRVGFRAAGATPDEISTFVPAVRQRIDQLRKVR